MPMQQNLLLNTKCAASLNKNAFLRQLTRNGRTASVLEVDLGRQNQKNRPTGTILNWASRSFLVNIANTPPTIAYATKRKL